MTKPTSTITRIIAFAKARPSRGITAHDVQKKFGISRSSASAALTKHLQKTYASRRNPTTGKRQNVYKYSTVNTESTKCAWTGCTICYPK